MAEEGEGAGRIDTVVLLMLENRSFDHMLGWMKRLNPEIDGVTGEEWNPVRAGGGNKVFFKDTARYVDPDPGHSFEAVTEQVFGSKTAPPQSTSNLHAAPAPPPPMNGFAEQAETVKPGMSEVVMNGFGPEALPVFAALVQDFAVFDRWFASLPTLTQPNRLFVHSATSHGEVANDNKNLLRGYPQRTVFESLLDSGRDFGVYYQSFPNVLFYRRMRNPRYARKFHRFDERFAEHARAGRLPNYVVIEPRYFDAAGLSPPANDDHPAHDVAEGQRLVKSVYETLRASPHWNRCVLLITYDEHGGFFDHVPSPVHGVPNPDGRVSPPPHSFAFDRLGVRVPTIAVSPWIEPRTVVHEPRGPFPTSQYEHSSVPATLKKLLGLTSGFLTKRDEWAGTFEHILFQRHTPRTDCPETLPSPPKLRDREAQEDAPLSEFQREMVELAAYLKGGFFRHRSRGLDGDEEEEQQQEEEEEMQSIVENMVVREARELVDEAVEQFFGEGLKLHDEDDIDENGNGRHGRGSSSDEEEEQQQEGHKHTQHHGPMRLLHKLLH